MSPPPNTQPNTPHASGGDHEEPRQLRMLRRLVTVLTATLIIGVLTIVAALVIRIAQPPARVAVTEIAADSVTLPAGEAITAVGATPSSLAIATKDAGGLERLRVFSPETGEPVGAVEVLRE